MFYPAETRESKDGVDSPGLSGPKNLRIETVRLCPNFDFTLSGPSVCEENTVAVLRFPFIQLMEGATSLTKAEDPQK